MNKERKKGWWKRIKLGSGGHTAPAMKPDNDPYAEHNRGVCVMEAVAWVAGEKHSDQPKCADNLLTGLMQGLNDNLSDTNRQKLKPFIPRLVDSRDGQTRKRASILIKFMKNNPSMCSDYELNSRENAKYFRKSLSTASRAFGPAQDIGEYLAIYDFKEIKPLLEEICPPVKKYLTEKQMDEAAEEELYCAEHPKECIEGRRRSRWEPAKEIIEDKDIYAWIS